MKRLQRRTKRNADIAPDEIFLDASNLPNFNRGRMEGHFERPIARRAFIAIEVVFVVIALFFISRLVVLQIIEGSAYAQESEENRLQHAVLFSERGTILDRRGEQLAWNTPGDIQNGFALRAYTPRAGLGHVLGYVRYPARDRDGFFYEEEYVGAGGVEAVFNTLLSGEHGVVIVETNARGAIISENSIRHPKDGKNITISLDAELTEVVYDHITALADERGFTGGAAVVMDVTTGEVIVLTSVPEINPNILTNGTEAEISAYRARTDTPFLNRAISGRYTPGSIVKPFVALAAIFEDIVAPTKEFLSTGSLEVENPYDPDNPTIFSDWKAHGYVDVYDALAMSSNVYFYYVSGGYGAQEGLGIARLADVFSSFGFGSKTGIALSGEVSGTIPTPEWKAEHFDGDPWRIGDTYNTAIGQYGFQVTALQMARATAAIANGGTLLTPSLRTGSAVEIAGRARGDASSFEVVHKGMREAVTRGTAQGLSVPYVAVAAKTGTAELGVAKKKVNSWTIGFFPYEEPRYAFALLMEQGPAQNLVGATAVMRGVFDWMRDHRPEYLNLAATEL